ncbi:zinc ribbon domain-containing protein [uncultured Methanobrevibacter sp.]|uniref:zinc ribbon domain-containing protein n=1 Tax=uncultured Methanobrevibacter sp. TaxID=253161 RepID=UPI0025D8EDC6|nr:zinc ribbon domain-containing protein [uncultured Methanobrevibacter sp.]
MKCPKCNKTYNKGNKFCIDCGTELIEDKNLVEVNPSVIPTVESEIGSLDVQLVNKKISQYTQEAELADRVYKSYVTMGISRLDKINGRFLASQTIKLDILIEQNKQLIEQNNTIIKLLEKISEK